MRYRHRWPLLAVLATLLVRIAVYGYYHQVFWVPKVDHWGGWGVGRLAGDGPSRGPVILIVDKVHLLPKAIPLALIGYTLCLVVVGASLAP